MPLSAAFPSTLGWRSRTNGLPDAASREGTWLVHHRPMAALWVASEDWSTGDPASSVVNDAGGVAFASVRALMSVHQEVRVSGLKPSVPSSLYRDSPCWSAHWDNPASSLPYDWQP